jgi:hypothetical protein
MNDNNDLNCSNAAKEAISTFLISHKEDLAIASIFVLLTMEEVSSESMEIVVSNIQKVTDRRLQLSFGYHKNNMKRILFVFNKGITDTHLKAAVGFFFSEENPWASILKFVGITGIFEEMMNFDRCESIKPDSESAPISPLWIGTVH